MVGEPQRFLGERLFLEAVWHFCQALCGKQGRLVYQWSLSSRAAVCRAPRGRRSRWLPCAQQSTDAAPQEQHQNDRENFLNWFHVCLTAGFLILVRFSFATKPVRTFFFGNLVVRRSFDVPDANNARQTWQPEN